MIIKARNLPIEIIKMRILNTRMNLTENDKQRLVYLEKGYEGEVKFDSLTASLQKENLIINDLLLNSNDTLFQIDSLIIFQEKIYLIDVKNFEGEYYYE